MHLIMKDYNFYSNRIFFKLADNWVYFLKLNSNSNRITNEGFPDFPSSFIGWTM